MNNVLTRSISGVVYVAAILCAIFFGVVPFFILTSLFTILGIREYFNLSHSPYGDKSKYYAIALLDIVGALLIVLSPAFIFRIAPSGTLLLFVAMLALYVLARTVLALSDTGQRAYREVAKSVFGVLYIGLPMFMLNYLYVSGGSQSQWLIFLMFAMIWLNDTGAFCFGSAFGKHRLCERLSPKKSWEGFWGGMASCVVFGIICFYTLNHTGFGFVTWIVLGVLVSLFSTWGDLFESMLKRTVNVKDSGVLIPGHGGILDRIDSLLFVAPVTAIFYMAVSSL